MLEITKKNLLNQIAALKQQNENLLETIKGLRVSNADLVRDMRKVNSSFEAFKVGAKEFHKLAEEQITLEASTVVDLKLKLINSLVSEVYEEAKATRR